MPLLAHGIDNTPLDGSPTGTTDWYTHLVVAGQTEELSLQFPGLSRQFLPVFGETLKHIKRERSTYFEPTVIDHFSCGLEIYIQSVGGVARLTHSCCS